MPRSAGGLKMKTLSSILCSLMLTGCVFGGNVKPPVIQESLLVKCPMLSILQDGTGGEVATTMIDHVRQHNACAIRHNGLVDAIRQER